MVGTRLKKPVRDNEAQPEGLPNTPGSPVIAGPGSCWFTPFKPHQFSVQAKELWANSHAGAQDRQWQHPAHTPGAEEGSSKEAWGWLQAFPEPRLLFLAWRCLPSSKAPWEGNPRQKEPWVSLTQSL
ncbi:hypothetical protein HJG60_009242 [Phyllostomus discolor]|uniref:Uncharacterized protein n=1 Tax=Phyllostomus discolor TaxID=89673 RepID=A0A833YSJ8_9CHIR|nr:hypothetical protein HJG60_009242 [Phyllostomus discolor]